MCDTPLARTGRRRRGPLFPPNFRKLKLLDKIGREFAGYNIVEAGKRLIDRKPLQCSLYVTDRCNLDCSYCTEYDNSRPHPKLEDLKMWIEFLRHCGGFRVW